MTFYTIVYWWKYSYFCISMSNFYRIFAKTIMLICIATQTIAMIPHHHHLNSMAFCINCTHICESASCDDSCHDTIPEDQDPLGCSSKEMMLIVPETPAFKTEISCADHHLHCLHCTCLPCNVATVAVLDDSKSSVIINDLNNTFIPQRHLTSVRTALPPRAPDFMV